MTNSTEYTKVPQAAHIDGGATLAIITPYSDSRAQKEFAKARTSLNDHMRYDGIIGLSQKDFASRINEKESMIHKIETGAFEPPLDLAKKLEKILGIKLVEEHLEKHEKFKRSKEGGFTLGDFIKVKK